MTFSNKKKEKSKETALLVIGIVVATIAIGCIAALIIDSLDDNAKKLHHFHVKNTEQEDLKFSTALDVANYVDKRTKQIDTMFAESNKLFAEADKLHNAQQFRKAIPLYQQSIDTLLAKVNGKLGFDDKRLLGQRYFKIAECYCQQGDYSTSVKFANKSLEFNPENTQSLDLRSNILTALGDTKSALRDHTAAENLRTMNKKGLADTLGNYRR